MSFILDKIDERLGARVRIERELKGWSLTELAKRSGVSRAMIHKVERGEASPTAMLLARLAGAFEISMSTLMVRAEMQEGLLVRKNEQSIWIDPITGYIRRHVSPRSPTPIDLIDIEFPQARSLPSRLLPTLTASTLFGFSKASSCFGKVVYGTK